MKIKVIITGATAITLREVGLAMINSVLRGYPKQVLEIEDIKLLA